MVRAWPCKGPDLTPGWATEVLKVKPWGKKKAPLLPSDPNVLCLFPETFYFHIYGVSMDPLPIFSAAFSALLCALETNLMGNANRFLSSLTSSSRTWAMQEGRLGKSPPAGQSDGREEVEVLMSLAPSSLDLEPAGPIPVLKALVPVEQPSPTTLWVC